METNEYLKIFFAELERLVDGHGTRHTISTAMNGELEVRFGAGDWYRVAAIQLSSDPRESALEATKLETKWPSQL